MEDLLTAQQVQDLLKVNRITVYRMLQANRLKGVKIGSQWRFPAAQFEQMLSTISPLSDQRPDGLVRFAFPVHCVQTIQNLYAEVSGVSAVVLDLAGNPLTQASFSNSFCARLMNTREGIEACRCSWREVIQQEAEEGWFTCHAGLHYYKYPLKENGKIVGFLLTGQVVCREINPQFELIARDAAGRCRIESEQLANELDTIPPCDAGQMKTIEKWAEKFARAVESILNERSGLVRRLQQIEEISSI